jgi:hypothetical protein
MIKLIEEWKIIISTIISISTATIIGFSAYTNILKSIDDNRKTIENTQIMILKTQVRTMEKYPCPISDKEWDDYIEKYTALFELLKLHGKLHKDAPWEPVERIKEKGTQCLK